VNKSTVVGKPFNSQSRVAYQCDTQPGNSGSSVIAFNSAGVPKVVAVHDAAAPDPIRYNIGTYMYDIRQVLKKDGVDLDKLTSATPLMVK
jgi:V8-like Glu-specific endopeptidase